MDDMLVGGRGSPPGDCAGAPKHTALCRSASRSLMVRRLLQLRLQCAGQADMLLLLKDVLRCVHPFLAGRLQQDPSDNDNRDRQAGGLKYKLSALRFFFPNGVVREGGAQRPLRVDARGVAQGVEDNDRQLVEVGTRRPIQEARLREAGVPQGVANDVLVGRDGRLQQASQARSVADQLADDEASQELQRLARRLEPCLRAPDRCQPLSRLRNGEGSETPWLKQTGKPANQ